MIPRVTRLGTSFKGAGAYYLHDKQASTSNRVGFTHTENIPLSTNDPHKALKFMAWTAMRAEELKRETGSGGQGRVCQKPVFAFSLSWHPDQNPHKSEMIGAGRTALAALGLSDHETLMVSHQDTDHPHLHVIVNTVHPETGRVNSLSHSKKKLSVWAEDYERKNNAVFCKRRIASNAARAERRPVHEEKDAERKKAIAEIFHASENGEALIRNLKQAGFQISKDKRIIITDESGATYSLAREVGVKAKELRAKLAGVDLPEFVQPPQGTPTDRKKNYRRPAHKHSVEKRQQRPATAANQNRAKDREPEFLYEDRDQQDRDWEESIIDAAIAASEATPTPPPTQPQTSGAVPPLRINALQDRQLDEIGKFTDKNVRERLHQEADHADRYSPLRRQLNEEIRSLQETLKNSGSMRLWWLKLTNQISKTPELDLENKQKTLRNMEMRQLEEKGGLEATIRGEGQKLEARQYRERRALQPSAPNSFKAKSGATYHRSPDELKRDVEAPWDSDDDDGGPSLDL